VAPHLFMKADVERLLPMAACIDRMATALADLSAGRIVQPVRTVFAPPDAAGVLVWMPAHRSGPSPSFGTKLLCFMPKNPERGLDAHQGVVVLFDGETGELRAVLDAATVTAIRTAAVSALATRLLAREDASELAIIGTGVQAERHLESMAVVRPIRRARIAGRTAERARAFVERLRGRHEFAIVAAEDAEAAVRGADIVVTATSSRTPVFDRRWLAPGMHICAVGASRPPEVELDAETLAACALYTDRRESLDAEAAEWQDGLRRGLFGAGHLVGEIGEVVAGSRPRRTQASQITLFRSLGLAAEDLAAAELVFSGAGAASG
jgi:ornithine cyclodeaminase/alanine dehydrogenase-like protein (mu-crystallin family)